MLLNPVDGDPSSATSRNNRADVNKRASRFVQTRDTLGLVQHLGRPETSLIKARFVSLIFARGKRKERKERERKRNGGSVTDEREHGIENRWAVELSPIRTP